MSHRLSMHHTSRALWLLATAIAIALIFAGAALTQGTQQKAPAKVAAPAAKAPGWCKNAAPIVNGIATVTISPVGATKNLKVDYPRVCIGTTDKIKWQWNTGSTEPANWSAEFFTGANPFPKPKYGKGNPTSDPPSVNGNDYLIYKYVVHADGYNDLDPDVIIKGGR